MKDSNFNSMKPPQGGLERFRANIAKSERNRRIRQSGLLLSICFAFSFYSYNPGNNFIESARGENNLVDFFYSHHVDEVWVKRNGVKQRALRKVQAGQEFIHYSLD